MGQQPCIRQRQEEGQGWVRQEQIWEDYVELQMGERTPQENSEVMKNIVMITITTI